MRCPRRHLTVKQVAARFAHSPKWVRCRIRDGTFEAFKHSRSDWTVSEDSVIAYEESTRIHVGPAGR
jgi:hypothetical protein